MLRHIGRGAGCIDDVAGFAGDRYGVWEIAAEQILGRKLVLAIEPGMANVEQRAAPKWLVEYGKQEGVIVNILEMK